VQDPIPQTEEVDDDIQQAMKGKRSTHMTPNEREGRKRDLGQSSRMWWHRSLLSLLLLFLMFLR
jgi:hypothetical protein